MISEREQVNKESTCMALVGGGGWDCISMKWMPKSKTIPKSSLPFPFPHCHSHFPSSQLNSFHLSRLSLSNPPLPSVVSHTNPTCRFVAAVQSSSSGYDTPPWIFKGSALYQLHLVKADVVRPIIPNKFRLYEAFGYTLGGFFLASYDESPVGAFDELVVLAGLVSDPTYCAWASRVLVSNKEACDHGRREVGLPSQVATFSKANNFSPLNSCVDVHMTEVTETDAVDLCSIKLTQNVLFSKLNKWMGMGPKICLSFPSFSGHTEYNPNLLKYSCDIETRVRMVQAAQVSGPSSPAMSGSKHDGGAGEISKLLMDDARSLSISVMLSKPILAIQFNCMKMQVEAPVVVS